MERPRETDPPSSVNRTPNRNAQPYLGGADAVEKTSAVADVHGADPNEASRSPVGLTATVPRSRGLGPIVWIIILLVALVVVGYAAGLLT